MKIQGKGNIRYVVCFQWLLENKLLLKAEMFTSIENRFMPLTENYFTASLAVALSSGYVSLTLTNNLAFAFSRSINGLLRSCLEAFLNRFLN